jgi:hypothetical protein
MRRSEVADARSQLRGASLARGALGLAFVLAGGAGLVALFYISNSRSAGAEHAMISLGLAGSVLASAVAQTLVVVGIWLLWRAARRGRAET